MDKKELFRYPVTRDIASDYYEIIKTPMSFADVIEKLSLHLYLTLDELAADLSLIWKNSMLYNKKDTLYYKLAQRLEKTTDTLMEQARQSYQGLHISKSGLLDVEIDQHIYSYVDDSLKINTVVDKENMPHESSSGLSSMSTISSDSTLSMKRRVSDVMDTPIKKPKTEEEHVKKHVSRVTRSRTQSNKRTLRSRSITKDMHHPVKMGRTESLPETRRKRTSLRRQTSTISEPTIAEPTKEEPVIDEPMIEEPEIEEQASEEPTIEQRSVAEPIIKEPVIIIQRQGRATRASSHQSDKPTVKIMKKDITATSKAPVKPKIVQLLKPRAPLERKQKIKMQHVEKRIQKSKNPTVNFENGELVWARVRGFPPHPARVSKQTCYIEYVIHGFL